MIAPVGMWPPLISRSTVFAGSYNHRQPALPATFMVPTLHVARITEMTKAGSNTPERYNLTGPCLVFANATRNAKNKANRTIPTHCQYMETSAIAEKPNSASRTTKVDANNVSDPSSAKRKRLYPTSGLSSSSKYVSNADFRNLSVALETAIPVLRFVTGQYGVKGTALKDQRKNGESNAAALLFANVKQLLFERQASRE